MSLIAHTESRGTGNTVKLSPSLSKQPTGLHTFGKGEWEPIINRTHKNSCPLSILSSGKKWVQNRFAWFYSENPPFISQTY